jgi:hypothetical protein
MTGLGRVLDKVCVRSSLRKADVGEFSKAAVNGELRVQRP